MGLFAPWFLAGLALLGVPVFVHLLRKHVTTPRPVSSLMFFERGIQSSTRHRKLRHLILFALRFALLLLVVVAFANPFLRRAATNTRGSLLLVVLDNSFSMRAADSFTEAKQHAVAMVTAKRPAQRAQIIALGGQVQVLTQPTSDTAQLRTAIDSLQQGDGHGSFAELARAIASFAEADRGPIDLHLFSDLQRSAVPANFSDLVLPRNVTLHLHHEGKGIALPNWTVESIEAPAQLSDPKDPRRSRVRAVVVGFNTPTSVKAISLVINGKVAATKPVNIPANGRVTVEFSPLDVAYGFNRCEIRVDGEDALPDDNSGYFSVRRSDPLRVLFVHAARDSRSPVYFAAALKAAPQSSFVLQSVAADQTAEFDPSRFAFVVLSGAVALPAIFDHALAQYVARGGSVLITLGTAAPRGTRIPLWDSAVLQSRDYARDGAGLTVGQLDFSHPALLDPKPSHDNGGWSEARFQYADSVDTRGARVAAQLSDGTPLLLDKAIGQGRVLLFTSGFDNLTNDLPLHPVFVAFIDRTARYLSGSDRVGGALVVDSFLALNTSTAASSQPSGVEVIDPGGHRPLSLSQARAAQSLRLEHAGFYRVRFADGRENVIGVNPDRLESDLQPMPDDLRQLWSAAPAVNPSSTDRSATIETSQSISLWWYVMLLASLVAFAETAFSSAYLGTQREEA